jgi:hypothetical protein
MKMEKKLKWWKEKGKRKFPRGFYLLVYTLVFLGLFTAFAMHRGIILNIIPWQQEMENESWLVFKQPYEDETATAVYNLLLTDLNFNERLTNLEKIVSASGDDLQQWRSFFVVYFSHQEQFKAVLTGEADPQKLVVQVDPNSGWTLFYISFTIFIAFGVVSLVIAKRMDTVYEKQKKSQEEETVKEN